MTINVEDIKPEMWIKVKAIYHNRNDYYKVHSIKNEQVIIENERPVIKKMFENYNYVIHVSNEIETTYLHVSQNGICFGRYYVIENIYNQDPRWSFKKVITCLGKLFS